MLTPAPAHTANFARIRSSVISTGEGKFAPLIVILSVGPFARTSSGAHTRENTAARIAFIRYLSTWDYTPGIGMLTRHLGIRQVYCCHRSLVTQGLDRIKVRGLARRVVAEDHADRHREDCCDQDGLRRYLGRPPERIRDGRVTGDARQHAQAAAEHAQHHRLTHELR